MVKEAIQRCSWCTTDALYIEYHDQEWGVPVSDELALFERLILEGMQAGLSWLTVLKKREHMRRCFFGFDPVALAGAGDADVDRWLEDAGLIRHRGKIAAMIGNARLVAELDGGFASLLWSFVDGKPQQNGFAESGQVPSETPTSVAMAKHLKKQGYRFVGPTTCYAFMQSAGLVNDHVTTCDCYLPCAELGSSWTL